MVVTSLLSLGQAETGSDFSNFKRKLHRETNIVIELFRFVLKI